MMSYLRWTFYQTKIFSVPDVLNGFDINKIQYIHHFHVIDVIQSKLLTLKHNDVVVSSKIYLTITATASLLRVSTNFVSTASNWTRHENSMNLKINVNCFCCHVYLFFHSTNYWTIWSWGDLMRIWELLLRWCLVALRSFIFITQTVNHRCLQQFAWWHCLCLQLSMVKNATRWFWSQFKNRCYELKVFFLNFSRNCNSLLKLIL